MVGWLTQEIIEVYQSGRVDFYPYRKMLPMSDLELRAIGANPAIKISGNYSIILDKYES